MYSTNFLVAVAERAVKTFAQTLLATIGADAAGVFTASTAEAATVAAGAALISVLTSFASASTGRTGPSLAGETTAPDIYITQSEPVKSAPKPAAKKTPAPAKKKAPAKKTASGKKPE
jgi:hypothetical protein